MQFIKMRAALSSESDLWHVFEIYLLIATYIKSCRIIAVHYKDEPLAVVIIMSPQSPDRLLTPYIPNSELYT